MPCLSKDWSVRLCEGITNSCHVYNVYYSPYVHVNQEVQNVRKCHMTHKVKYTVNISGTLSIQIVAHSPIIARSP